MSQEGQEHPLLPRGIPNKRPTEAPGSERVLSCQDSQTGMCRQPAGEPRSAPQREARSPPRPSAPQGGQPEPPLPWPVSGHKGCPTHRVGMQGSAGAGCGQALGPHHLELLPKGHCGESDRHSGAHLSSTGQGAHPSLPGVLQSLPKPHSPSLTPNPLSTPLEGAGHWPCLSASDPSSPGSWGRDPLTRVLSLQSRPSTASTSGNARVCTRPSSPPEAEAGPPKPLDGHPGPTSQPQCGQQPESQAVHGGGLGLQVRGADQSPRAQERELDFNNRGPAAKAGGGSRVGTGVSLPSPPLPQAALPRLLTGGRCLGWWLLGEGW